MSALDARASSIGFLKRVRCLSLSHSLKRFMELTGLQADDARFGCWGSMERKVALRTQCFCKFLRIRRMQFYQLDLVLR